MLGRWDNRRAARGSRSAGAWPGILTGVLEATGRDPQVKTPAPGLETGSQPSRADVTGSPHPPSHATLRTAAQTPAIRPLPAVVNTPTAGSGDDTRSSTRTPSSGMPPNGFQEHPWRAQEDGEGGRGPGVGVVLAQDAAAAGQGIFGQLPGRLLLADPAQAHDEVVGGGQGVGVVLAQDAAAAGQGVFAQLPGRLVLLTARRLMARPWAEARVSGWSSPRTRRRRARVSSPSSRAAWYSPR